MNTSQLQFAEQESTPLSSETGTPMNSTAVEKNSNLDALFHSTPKTLESVLQHIFPEQQEQTRILKARQIMGEAVANLTDDQLDTYLTEFQYLIDSWLDTYEKEQFNGLTLQQVLRKE